MIYKVSCVVVDGTHPGAIVNLDTQPVAGEEIQLNGEQFEVVEVTELLPPREGFAYLHVTCRQLQESDTEDVEG